VAVARVQRSTGEVREAIEGLQEVLPESSRPDRAYRELASSFEQVGELREAETCLKLAVAMDGDDWLNWNTLGSFHLRTGRYPAARDAYARAAELAPSDVTWPRENLATLDLLEGRFEAAAEAYEALPGVESNASLASNLGTAYYFLGRLDEAEPYYRRAVILDPANPKMRRNLADLYLAQGREEAARSEYREALDLIERKLDVESGGTLEVVRALLTAKVGDCAEAVPLAARLREELPTTATIAHDLAAAFALCGERERALDALEDALEEGMSPELILNEDEFRPLHDAPEIRRLLEGAGGAPEPAR
jgi:Flp pilus assembly protein TadD